MSAAALTRRTVLAGMAAVPFTRRADAQAAWPNRPVRVIVPYPPAGGADTTARIVFGKLGEMFGQQFVIENRGGAGGTIAEGVAAKADPDGYTVLHDATAFSVVSLSERETPSSSRICLDGRFGGDRLASSVPPILA